MGGGGDCRCRKDARPRSCVRALQRGAGLGSSGGPPPREEAREPHGRAPEPGESREPQGAPGGAPGRACARPGRRAAVHRALRLAARRLGDAAGIPARIFVALLTADTSSLTADELAGLLQVSPAAVSGGVRYLVQVGLVSRETDRQGSRRHVYRMPGNVWHEVLRVRDRIMMRWADTMRDGADVFGAGTPARVSPSRRCTSTSSARNFPGCWTRWEEYKAAHWD